MPAKAKRRRRGSTSDGGFEFWAPDGLRGSGVISFKDGVKVGLTIHQGKKQRINLALDMDGLDFSTFATNLRDPDVAGRVRDLLAIAMKELAGAAAPVARGPYTPDPDWVAKNEAARKAGEEAGEAAFRQVAEERGCLDLAEGTRAALQAMNDAYSKAYGEAMGYTPVGPAPAAPQS